MKKLIAILSVFIIQSYALAFDRPDANQIFNEHAKGEGTQVLLGIGDVIVAQMLYTSSKDPLVRAAEENLQLAETGSKDSVQVSIGEDSFEPNTEEVKKAEEKLARARKQAIESAKSASTGSKVIKGIKIVGSTIFVLDLVGRIYVWNVMDRNPTISPVGTVSLAIFDSVTRESKESASRGSSGNKYLSGTAAIQN